MFVCLLVFFFFFSFLYLHWRWIGCVGKKKKGRRKIENNVVGVEVEEARVWKHEEKVKEDKCLVNAPCEDTQSPI